MSAEDIYEKISYARSDIASKSELNKYVCLYLACKEKEDGNIDKALTKHVCQNFLDGKIPRTLKKRCEKVLADKEKLIAQLDKRVAECVGKIDYVLFKVNAAQADKVKSLIDAYNKSLITPLPIKSITPEKPSKQNKPPLKRKPCKVEPILPECDPEEKKE